MTMRRVLVAAVLVVFACSFSFSAAAAEKRKNITKVELLATMKEVVKTIRGKKHDEVVRQVTAKLGPPHKTEPAMISWFAKDQGKCFQLWVTWNKKDVTGINVDGDTTTMKDCE